MTEKNSTRMIYVTVGFFFISWNIAFISLILQKPKPAFGDRASLTIILVIIDVIALMRVWAMWYHARRTASSTTLQNPAEPLPNPDEGAVKDRGDPTLKSAFFLFAFCSVSAALIGDCIITFANPHDHTFPTGFKWAMIPPAAIFFLFALVLLFFIGRYIVRTLWKRWKAKW